jgi:hypothetical protein
MIIIIYHIKYADIIETAINSPTINVIEADTILDNNY